MPLTNKVAIITGSGRGLGKAMAEVFAAKGASVVISDINKQDGKNVAKDLTDKGYKAIFVPCNVVNRNDVKDLFAVTKESFGSVDILINNAGITRDAMIHKMTEQDWDLVLDINLKGTFNCLQEAALVMREQESGHIINISSISSQGNIGQANYSAAKAGVIGMTKTASLELGKKGITVNAICPGFIKTEMTDIMPDKVKEMMAAKIPLGRMGEPEDIAFCAAFLASREAKFINGCVIDVNGGMRI